MPRLPRLALLAALVVAFPVRAATVDLQVSDGAGKPLPGAALFLESKDAQAVAKLAKRYGVSPHGLIPSG